MEAIKRYRRTNAEKAATRGAIPRLPNHSRVEAIRQLIPDFSGPQISELLGIPLDTVRDVCKLAGIHMPRGPRGKHKPRTEDNESGFHNRRYVVAGSSPCFMPGGIHKEGEKVEQHGPVRILMQNGRKV